MLPFTLPPALSDLLREVVVLRCPEVLGVIEAADQTLSVEVREIIAEALSHELSMTGMGADGEVNVRGAMLDELMGAFVWDDPNEPFRGFPKATR